jgi:hypothetical protein
MATAKKSKYQQLNKTDKSYYRKFAAARVMASRVGLTINKLSKQDKVFVINTEDNFTKYFDDIDTAYNWIKTYYGQKETKRR